MASREGPPQASSRQAAEDRRAGGVSGSPFAIMRPSGKQWYTNLIPVVPPEIDGFLIDSPSPIPTLERWQSPEPPPQQSIASGGDTPYTFNAIEPAAPAAVDAAGKEAAAAEKGRLKHTPIAPRRKNPRYPWRRPAPPKLQNVPDFVMCPSTFRIKSKPSQACNFPLFFSSPFYLFPIHVLCKSCTHFLKLNPLHPEIAC